MAQTPSKGRIVFYCDHDGNEAAAVVTNVRREYLLGVGPSSRGGGERLVVDLYVFPRRDAADAHVLDVVENEGAASIDGTWRWPPRV